MDNVKIIQKAVIKESGKILLLKRSDYNNVLPDHWELPGGNPNFGEDPEKAIIREVKEETDLDVNVVKPIAVRSYISKFPPHQYCFAVIYLCEKLSEKIKLSNEHTEFKWVTVEEAKLMEIVWLLKSVLDEL